MSLTTRAVIAIALMIGFYMFSIAVAAGLLYIPYAEYVYLERVHLKLAFASIVAAGVILWSIFPRRDRFEEPGPRITAQQHPRLFDELESIAQQTGQKLPAEVYLVPDVNAWVAQRGGTMGFGSRRVMGLGVPLMRVLTVSQFRAVLAHEFGHYVGGDTALGPWIYKTRAAITRTLLQLQAANSLVIVLFNWYGKMFMRITLAISRAQEYAADRLGAQVAGARAMIDGLKQVHVGGVAWNSYLNSEVVPVLGSGLCPPLSQGFVKFLEAPAIKSAVSQDLQKELSTGKADPYDSHPALPERIAALQSLPGQGTEDNRPATDLLDNYDAADTSLLSAQVAGLKPVSWDDVVQKVYVANWERQVRSQEEALSGLTIETLGRDLYSWELRNRLKPAPGTWPSNDERDVMARTVAGCAVSLTLLRNGWTVRTAPGEPMTFAHDGTQLEPFTMLQKVSQGEMKPEAWKSWCEEMGIATLPVSAVFAAGAAGG